MEHELRLVFDEELGRALDVDEQGVDTLDVLDLHLDALALCADEGGGDDELDGVVQKVCETMKDEKSNKSRVTFYYLCAKETGTLGQLA